MNRSFVYKLAFVVMFSLMLTMTTLPAHDVIVAQAKSAASATPSKTAPAVAKGVQRIIFTANKNGATNIFAMDPDGKNIVQLTKSGDYKLFPTFSPDGRQVAFLSTTRASGPPQLKVMDADGKNLRQLTLGKAVAISPPAWSPDSSEIAYISVRAQPKDSGIYIFNVAKKQESKLELAMPVDFSYKPDKNYIALTDAFAPSWSPDGKYLLAFGGMQFARGKTTLIIARDSGAVHTFVRSYGIVATNAVWSPVKNEILYVALEKKGQFTRYSLQIANADGVILSELPSDPTVMPVVPSFPSWSPDGRRIVFSGISFTTKMARIYVMNTDGTDFQQLTSDTFSKGDVYSSWAVVPAELVKRK